jgi:hypothetical protein
VDKAGGRKELIYGGCYGGGGKKIKLLAVFEDSPIPLAKKVVSSFGLFRAGCEPNR